MHAWLVLFKINIFQGFKIILSFIQFVVFHLNLDVIQRIKETGLDWVGLQLGGFFAVFISQYPSFLIKIILTVFKSSLLPISVISSSPQPKALVWLLASWLSLNVMFQPPRPQSSAIHLPNHSASPPLLLRNLDHLLSRR